MNHFITVLLLHKTSIMSIQINDLAYHSDITLVPVRMILIATRKGKFRNDDFFVCESEF